MFCLLRVNLLKAISQSAIVHKKPHELTIIPFYFVRSTMNWKNFIFTCLLVTGTSHRDYSCFQLHCLSVFRALYFVPWHFPSDSVWLRLFSIDIKHLDIDETLSSNIPTVFFLVYKRTIMHPLGWIVLCFSFPSDTAYKTGLSESFFDEFPTSSIILSVCQLFRSLVVYRTQIWMHT